MFNEFVRNNLRTIIITILVVIAAVIAYGIYISVSQTGKVAVTVAVVPSDAHTTINGQSVSSGTQYLPAGEYTVKSSKEGFEDLSKTQHIDENQATIVMSLVAQSDEAKKWADDHQSDYLANEALAGEAADDFSTAYRDKNPIVNVLPYDNYLYTIGYTNDQRDPTNNSIILTIDASEGYRNAAVDQIRELGYDPTDYTIKFNDYKNPFAL